MPMLGPLMEHGLYELSEVVYIRVLASILPFQQCFTDLDLPRNTRCARLFR